MEDGIPEQQQDGCEALLSISDGNGLNEAVAVQRSSETHVVVGGDESRHPWRYRLLAVFMAVGLLALSFSFGFGSARHWSFGHKEFVSDVQGKIAKLPAPPLSSSRLGVAEDRELILPSDLTADNIPICVVNTIAAFFLINQAGTEIASANLSCADKTVKHKAGKIACTARTFGVLQSFVSTGALISGLWTQCDPQVNLPADCGANTLGLLGAIFKALEGGLGTYFDCNGETDDNAPRNKPGPVTGLKAGWCWVSVGCGANCLASLGATINVLVEQGPCQQGNTSTKYDQASCAAGISSVFALASNLVSSFAGASSTCSEKAVPKAGCVSDWGSVLAALSSIAAAGAQFLDTCAQVGRGNNTFGAGPQVGIGNNTFGAGPNLAAIAAKRAVSNLTFYTPVSGG